MGRVRRFPASERDKEFVVALRFLPESQAGSLSGTRPDQADQWWASVKDDLWVLKDGQEGGRPVGYLITRSLTEVSIVLAPAERGKGIGPEALSSLWVGDLLAFIRPRNRASVRAFTKAGFRRDEGRGNCAVYLKRQPRSRLPEEDQ